MEDNLEMGLSIRQLDYMKKLSKECIVINVNNLLNYDDIRDSLNEIQNNRVVCKIRNRHCDRYTNLGINIIDAVNLIIE